MKRNMLHVSSYWCILVLSLCVNIAVSEEPQTERDVSRINKSRCPSGWSSYGTKCIKLFHTKRSWDQSQNSCKSNGGTLVKISSSAEQNVIGNLIRNSGTSSYALWVGLRANPSTKQFRWTDGTRPSYLNWGNGEPNHHASDEYCTQVYKFSQKWNDQSCSGSVGYICEKIPSTGCPTGWTRNNNKCFKVYTQLQTWDMASSSCKRDGAALVKVSSKTEQDFVSRLGKASLSSFGMWIGLRADPQTKIFKWVDGSKAYYTYWSTGEPNFYSPDEYCVEMYIGWTQSKWNDQSCSATRPFMCQRGQGVPPPVPQTPPPVPPTSSECGKRYYGMSRKAPVPQISANGTRVVSGRDAQAHSWPWQVQLISRSGRHFCGGSLITDQWVVTAAHCVRGESSSSFQVRVGKHSLATSETSQKTFSVLSVTSHPKYRNLDYDIAVIKLAGRVQLNDKVNLVCLPKQGRSPSPGKDCYITGWGRTGSSRPGATILQEAMMPVIDNQKCSKAMSRHGTISSNMICAGFGGSSTVSGCFGDSGGPFVCKDSLTKRWVLQGAVSWGSRTCSSGYEEYTVFARVSQFVSWIHSFTGPINPPVPPTNKPQSPPPPRPPTLGPRPPTLGPRPPTLGPRPPTAGPPSPPIPQTPTPPKSCSPGWTTYGNRCYKFFNLKKTFDSALQFCQTYRGSLVKISSGSDQRFVSQLFRSSGSQSYAAWIGLRADPSTKIFRWSVDKTQLSGYSLWYPGEPNFHGSDEYCTQMYQYGSSQWNDQSCAANIPFICQHSLSVGPKPPVTSSPPVPPVGSCGKKGPHPGHVNHVQRIVGGRYAHLAEYPWQVALLSKSSNFQFCGGSLIASLWVLTAAHCVKSSSSWSTIKVRLGEHNLYKSEGNEQDILLTRIIKHPLYGQRGTDYDIALLKLSRPVVKNKYVNTICLNKYESNFPAGTKCLITGWGKVAQGGSSSSILKEASVPLVSKQTCQGSYGKASITDRMICAGYRYGGTDTCQGDSGGPLVCEKGGRWYLTGITSWGAGCAKAEKYGVYTKVSNLYSWIIANMK